MVDERIAIIANSKAKLKNIIDVEGRQNLKLLQER